VELVSLGPPVEALLSADVGRNTSVDTASIDPGVYVWNVMPYNLNAETQCNGTAFTVISTSIDTFPYVETFENYENGWSSGGTENSWKLGTPQKHIIRGASSGVNAWVVGGLTKTEYPNSEESYVMSPLFNFSNFTLSAPPVLRMKIWIESEDRYDGAKLQYRLHPVQLWQDLGTVSDGWYTFSDVLALSWTGSTTAGWSGV
jgi:hypothetical protein